LPTSITGTEVFLTRIESSRNGIERNFSSTKKQKIKMATTKTPSPRKPAKTPPEGEYMLWEDMKKMYHDRFVLIENPVYEPKRLDPIGGFMRYKHKSKEQVYKKLCSIDSKNLFTVLYTGGPLEERFLKTIFIL
jgi:hypothetical protein